MILIIQCSHTSTSKRIQFTNKIVRRQEIIDSYLISSNYYSTYESHESQSFRK